MKLPRKSKNITKKPVGGGGSFRGSKNHKSPGDLMKLRKKIDIF